jgi:hypothetical protein
MTPRRAVVALLLALVLFGVVAQIVRGPTAASAPTPVVTRDPTPSTPLTHDPTPSTPLTHDLNGTLAAVQHAFNAGDVRRLCRPGTLIDPAVIRQQNDLPGGCESELEQLIANEAPLRLTVHRVVARRDLASADVRTASGSTLSVDLVRGRRRWLLSFSGGNDPMPALAS